MRQVELMVWMVRTHQLTLDVFISILWQDLCDFAVVLLAV
jgi:hypothetical protein